MSGARPNRPVILSHGGMRPTSETYLQRDVIPAEKLADLPRDVFTTPVRTITNVPAPTPAQAPQAAAVTPPAVAPALPAPAAVVTPAEPQAAVTPPPVTPAPVAVVTPPAVVPQVAAPVTPPPPAVTPQPGMPPVVAAVPAETEVPTPRTKKDLFLLKKEQCIKLAARLNVAVSAEETVTSIKDKLATALGLAGANEG
jgi:hypothetical protein